MPEAEKMTGVVSDGRIGLRERRRRQTRRELIMTALELFSKQDYESTTVEQIAEAAAISVATFYRHFQSKESVVLFDLDERSERVRTALECRSPGTSLLEALREVNVSLARERAEGPDRKLFELRSRVYRSSPALLAGGMLREAESYDFIAKLVAQEVGLEADAALPRFVAGSIVGALASDYWVWPSDGRFAEQISETFDLLEATVGRLLAGVRSRSSADS